MKENSNLSDILNLINQADRILVCSHFNPDADAYASSCALTKCLLKLGKQVICVNADGASDRYRCIPGSEVVTKELPQDNSELWNLVIACDSGSRSRVGDAFQEKLFIKGRTIVNIDHHISNSYFGDLNYVIPHASSTAEVIFQIAEKANWALDQDIASALLSGIYGDTGGFRYSSTSTETFRVAQCLIQLGAKPAVIAQELFSRKPLASVRLQAQAYSELKLVANNRIAYSVVSAESMKKAQATPDDTEGLVESIRDIDGVQIAVFIYWHTDLWKLSLRSKKAQQNVSIVAEKFGGGGHVQAAAFRWRKSLDELLGSLLPELEAIVD